MSRSVSRTAKIARRRRPRARRRVAVDVLPDAQAEVVRVDAALVRAHDLVVAHDELERAAPASRSRLSRMRLCQYDAQPSFMILVSICGMKYCASSWTMVSRSLSHSARYGLWSRMKSSRSSSGTSGDLAQIGLDVLLRPVDALERIGLRLRRRRARRCALPRRSQLAHGEVAPALQRRARARRRGCSRPDRGRCWDPPT